MSLLRKIIHSDYTMAVLILSFWIILCLLRFNEKISEETFISLSTGSLIFYMLGRIGRYEH